MPEKTNTPTTHRRPFTPSPQVGAGPAFSPGRPRMAAVVRIVFGLIWAIDASFKWLPGFIHGQELSHQFAAHSQVKTPVIEQWIWLWQHIASASPPTFAIVTAIIETLIALGFIFGAFSNVVFIGSAIYSFGVWSGAEAFGLPWNAPGITDVGPSVAYIFAALALYCAAAGSTWSVDRAVLRRKLGRYAWLTTPAPAGPDPTGTHRSMESR